MTEIILKDIFKSYDQTEVIHGVDLKVESGKFLVLVGPSGCGKSTLLRIIAGLERITSGEILIDGNEVSNIPASERGLAMVFQSYALYPHMSVFKNMAFALENLKIDKKTIEEKVNSAAKLLQIEEYLQRKPKALSGGQRQRVAIGRAIVRDPKAFLFDEPLSNLDAELRVTMRKELSALHEKIGGTMIYVTHDQVEAMTLADRIVIMKDGIIEQIGSPLDLFERPATKFVATFIGSPSMNMISATIVDENNQLTMRTDDGIFVPVPNDKKNSVKNGQKISFGFRAEDIVPLRFGQKPNNYWDMQSKVNLAEPLGTETLIFTNFGSVEIVSRMFTPEQVNSDETLDFSLNLDRTYLFDGETGMAI